MTPHPHPLSPRWQPFRGKCLISWATNGLPSWPTSYTLWPSSWACLAPCSFVSDTLSLWVYPPHSEDAQLVFTLSWYSTSVQLLSLRNWSVSLFGSMQYGWSFGLAGTRSLSVSTWKWETCLRWVQPKSNYCFSNCFIWILYLKSTTYIFIFVIVTPNMYQVTP